MESLRSEVQSLRNQVEELQHQLQQAQNQQRAMYSDVDKRLSKQQLMLTDSNKDKPTAIKQSAGLKEGSVAKKPVTAAANVSTQPDAAEEQQIYQTAYDLIKAKKYNEAVSTLQKMLQKYPSGQFAANAHYWLGELYGLLNKNDQSAREFETVVKDYPDSAKVADAQLKLGLIYAGEFKWSDARAAFKKVITHYPGTASARLASEQLRQIKQAQTNIPNS
jgi:tol-pal system protein YbgF